MIEVVVGLRGNVVQPKQEVRMRFSVLCDCSTNSETEGRCI